MEKIDDRQNELYFNQKQIETCFVCCFSTALMSAENGRAAHCGCYICSVALNSNTVV